MPLHSHADNKKTKEQTNQNKATQTLRHKSSLQRRGGGGRWVPGSDEWCRVGTRLWCWPHHPHIDAQLQCPVPGALSCQLRPPQILKSKLNPQQRLFFFQRENAASSTTTPRSGVAQGSPAPTLRRHRDAAGSARVCCPDAHQPEAPQPGPSPPCPPSEGVRSQKPSQESRDGGRGAPGHLSTGL